MFSVKLVVILGFFFFNFNKIAEVICTVQNALEDPMKLGKAMKKSRLPTIQQQKEAEEKEKTKFKMKYQSIYGSSFITTSFKRLSSKIKAAFDEVRGKLMINSIFFKQREKKKCKKNTLPK